MRLYVSTNHPSALIYHGVSRTALFGKKIKQHPNGFRVKPGMTKRQGVRPALGADMLCVPFHGFRFTHPRPPT
jgi:hypothetical protein